MRLFLPVLFAAILTPPALAAPPRKESPAPRENLQSFGQGSSDEEMAKAIVAANAYPLGTLQNPIRVAGPDGAHAYLARLRCADSSTPAIGREAPGSTDAFGTLTTIVPVTCGTGPPAPLVFDFYQEEFRETRPAQGFSLAP
jgi:hypothetical protein